MSKVKASVLITNLLALAKKGRSGEINDGYLCAENEACDGVTITCESCPLSARVDLTSLENVLPIIKMQELVDE